MTTEQSYDEINGQEFETTGTFSTQSDRFRQPTVAGSNPTPGSSLQVDVAPTNEDFDLIIDSCRRGRTTKSATTKKLLESLERLTNISPYTKEKTFVSYLAEINSIERGNIEPSLTLGPDDRSGGGADETEGEHDRRRLPPEKEDTFTDRIIGNIGKRAVVHGDDDEPQSGSKRQRMCQSDMPWYGIQRGRGLINRALSCNRTCELLELYGEDLPRSKFLIRTAAYTPEGIQASQWERILKGESLNLDHFLSSIVRTQIDEDRKARIGETHLTFSTSDAKRKVRNAADWAAAWRRASEAVAFAFPHRREELDEYQRHIQVEFDAKQASAHQRIISYDIAVRNYVGGGQTSLLTDRERFSHLYSAIILPDGIEFATGFTAARRMSPNATKTSKSTETCNKYNTTPGCPHSPCRYRHVCKKCGGDHSQNECDSSQKR